MVYYSSILTFDETLILIDVEIEVFRVCQVELPELDYRDRLHGV